MNRTICLVWSRPWTPMLIAHRYQYCPVSFSRCNSYYTRKYPTDYYTVLGVKRDASSEDIKNAYLNLSKKHHPDVNPSPGSQKNFVQIREAYSVLSKPSAREEYDMKTFSKSGIPHSQSYTDDPFNYRNTMHKEYHSNYHNFHEKDEKFMDKFPFVFLVLCILSMGVYFPVWRYMVDVATRPSKVEKIQSFQSKLYFKKKRVTEGERKSDKS